MINAISSYAPQKGLDAEARTKFWEAYEHTVQGIPGYQQIFIGGDLNGI